MSKEFDYLVFAMEYYRYMKGLSGREAAEVFSQNALYDVVLNNYYLYHIESPDHMVADLDKYVKAKSKSQSQ